MRRLLIAALAVTLPTGMPSAVLAKAPATWDGLVIANSKRIGLVYLLPGADFRGYSKVMIDRPEIAFEKSWQKDQKRNLTARVSDNDLRRAVDDGSRSFATRLADAYARAGFQVVDQAGPDVIRISTAAINIKVTAPDVMTAGRSRTYASDAGEATLVVEARDSLSGALMGRALDRKVVGDNPRLEWTSSVTNRSDFDLLFKRWADAAAEGLRKLQAMSPINGDGQTTR